MKRTNRDGANILTCECADTTSDLEAGWSRDSEYFSFRPYAIHCIEALYVYANWFSSPFSRLWTGKYDIIGSRFGLFKMSFERLRFLLRFCVFIFVHIFNLLSFWYFISYIFEYIKIKHTHTQIWHRPPLDLEWK